MNYILLAIATFIFFVFAFFVGKYLLKQQKKRKKAKNFKVGDIVTLHHRFRNIYPQLPSNNPFTIVGLENDKVHLKYIHFKSITIHFDTVVREAIKKVS